MSIDLFSQGAEVGELGVTYRVFAPVVSRLVVEILSPTGALLRSFDLKPAGEGCFSGMDPQGRTGDRYKYSPDGAPGLPDPASRWQPEGVHGPAMVIDPRTYAWKDQGWQKPQVRDLAIYELHVGAFTPAGTFLAAIEKLGYLRDLGVTALELMPIADFPGAHNWGYDGVSLFAPSRAYGHPDDLRALVDAAHGHGLAMILDVVYNHVGPDGNYLHAYLGDYLDESAKTPWGGAIRYGDPAFRGLRDLVVSNPGYWMREFHMDGFRLDATHAIFDESPRHILQELTASIHAGGGFAIAEDSRNDVRLILPEVEGGMGFDAVWADDFHHVVRVANTHEDEGYLADFHGTLEEAVETIRHGWLYRGQPPRSGGGPRGTLCDHLPPERFVHCTSNHDQTGNHAFGERLAHRIHPTALRAAETLLCLTPYTPMLFMGQEWAASTPFLFFTDHNEELGKLIVEGRRSEFRSFAAFNDPALLQSLPNPQNRDSFLASKLAWKESNEGGHGQTLELFRSCLALRASEGVWRPTDRTGWHVEGTAFGIGTLRLSSAHADWLVLFDLQGGHRGSLTDESAWKTSHGPWKVVLSSNEERFGGTGTCAVQMPEGVANFSSPETVILRAENA